MRHKLFLLSICSLICAGFLIYMLFPSVNAKYSNRKIALRKSQSLNDISSLHLASSTSPLCLIILDTRSNIAVDNSTRLLYYFAGCPVKVEPIVTYVNSAPISEFPNARRLEKSALNGYNYPKDSLYFYDSNGKLLYISPLARDIKAILTDLDEILLGNNSASSQLELTIGNNIRGLSLSNIVNSSYERGHYWFYLIFSDICLGCKSGNSLIELDDYCEKNNGIGSTFIAVNEYSSRDIADFKLQHGISSEIISPSSEFIESWRNTERQMERLHPWDGTILVVNQLGVIVYKSKSAGDCIKWVGSQNNGEEK